MKISKHDQRVLHVSAQGGAIHFGRMTNGENRDICCFARDGHVLAGCSSKLFDSLNKRRLTKSEIGHPYRAKRLGVCSENSLCDNR